MIYVGIINFNNYDVYKPWIVDNWMQLLFAIAVDIMIENVREGLMNEVLCADNLLKISCWLFL